MTLNPTFIAETRELIEAEVGTGPFARAHHANKVRQALPLVLGAYEEAVREIERLNARIGRLCVVPHSKPYDPKHPDDLQRLVREVGGYMETCRGSCGSDTKGRDHAIECLDAIASALLSSQKEG